MPLLTESVTMSWKGVYRWPCSYSITTTCWSLVSAAPPSLWSSACFGHAIVFSTRPTNLNQAQFTHILCCWSSRQTAVNKVQEEAPGSRPQRLSESYWRDTWRRLSSEPFPGHCCCCACAFYQSSGTACALSPERIRDKKFQKEQQGNLNVIKLKYT